MNFSGCIFTGVQNPKAKTKPYGMQNLATIVFAAQQAMGINKLMKFREYIDLLKDRIEEIESITPKNGRVKLITDSFSNARLLKLIKGIESGTISNFRVRSSIPNLTFLSGSSNLFDDEEFEIIQLWNCHIEVVVEQGLFKEPLNLGVWVCREDIGVCSFISLRHWDDYN